MKAKQTFRKSPLMMGAAACAMLLASCGPSNDPNATPTPSPSATVTPTPTPTSTEPAPEVAFDNDFSASSGRLYIYAYFTPDGGMETFSDSTRIASAVGGLAFIVSPETAIFGFHDLDDPVEFAASTLTGATDTLRTYVNGDEMLTLELPFGNVLRASYERKEQAIVNTVNGNLRSTRILFAFDPVTTTDAIGSDLVYTGSALVHGGTAGTTTDGQITSPQVNFTVDAATDSLVGSIQVFEDVGGTPTLVFEFPVNIPLEGEGNSFSTTEVGLTDTANGFTGALSGTLAGADREEILFIFGASHDDGRKFVGSFIGRLPAP